jgi:hypothetical protein
MRKLGLAFLFFAAPAAAQFYSFYDWERTTFPEQVAYIMGAFDAMSVTKTIEDLMRQSIFALVSESTS